MRIQSDEISSSSSYFSFAGWVTVQARPSLLPSLLSPFLARGIVFTYTPIHPPYSPPQKNPLHLRPTPPLLSTSGGISPSSVSNRIFPLLLFLCVKLVQVFFARRLLLDLQEKTSKVLSGIFVLVINPSHPLTFLFSFSFPSFSYCNIPKPFCLNWGESWRNGREGEKEKGNMITISRQKKGRTLPPPKLESLSLPPLFPPSLKRISPYQ